jgi:hypothetical protein
MLDKVEDHHIFPAEYLKSLYKDIDNENALSLIDCVLNKTLIPKITNIKIGKKKPSEYLAELKNYNSDIEKCIENHLIPAYLIDGTYDDFYTVFLEDRAKLILSVIKKNIIEKTNQVMNDFYQSPPVKITGNVKVFANYSKKKLDATFDIDTETVLFNSRSYSVSQAAEVAKKSISGKDTSTNGWQFWRYLDNDGIERSINTYRKNKRQ